MKSLPNGLIVNGDLDLLETSIRELKTAYLFRSVTEQFLWPGIGTFLEWAPHALLGISIPALQISWKIEAMITLSRENPSECFWAIL